jgi:4-hydroxy-3-polyprenylbenzoate decarboxylase
MTREFIIAITGASGALYAKKLFDSLIENKARIHLLISDNGKRIIKSELDLSSSYFEKEGVVIHDHSQLNSKIASGSFRHNGMVIIPASMGCIGRIASGVSEDLITRSADVALKEGFSLICVPRETPYNTIHLKNMLALSQAGAVILPASPGFYHNPKNLDEISAFIVSRILCQLNIKQNLLPTWEPNNR